MCKTWCSVESLDSNQVAGIGSITHILNLDVGTGQALGLAGELSFGRTIILLSRDSS